MAVVAGAGCGGGKKGGDDTNKPPTMPDTGVTAQTLRFVSTPVRAASVGQPTHYRAVASAPGDTQYTLMRAPASASVDPAGIVTWTPGEGESGVQTFVVRAVNGTQTATQQFTVTTARRTPQAVGTIDPANPNGGQVSVDAPVSRVRGAAVQMEPGTLPAGQPVAITISEVDQAPVPVAATVRQVPQTELRTVDLEPNGLTFAQPVRVYLPATPMVLAMGKPEVQTYDYGRGRWEKVKVVGYDADRRLVVAEVRHFSTYVVTPPANVMDLQTNVGAAGSACAEALVVRAPVTLGFAQMPASAVNGYAGDAATVADVLGQMQPGHALQLYTRVEAHAGAGSARGWVLASATKQADGTFKVNVTSDRSSTPLLAAPAALAATDPELLAFWNGSRTDVVLGGLGSLAAGAQVQADASVYLVAAVDADRPPVEIANTLGSESVDVAARPEALAAGVDDDCDGAANAYDPVPTGEAAPLLSTTPASPARVTVGSPLALAAWASLPGTTFTWSASDPSVAVAPSADGASATVRPSAQGAYRVKVVATHGAAASAASWDVIADPPIAVAGNTPPTAKLAASANVVRTDERVSLQAVAFDREQTELAFRWSSNVPGVVSASGPAGVFVAREPGDYLITCVANDGLTDSPPATIAITVLGAAANRPPRAPVVVPLSAALEHAAGVPVTVTLTASAVDPDGDAVTIDFVPDPTTPPSARLTKAGATATFTTAVDGTYLYYVTATDANGAVSPWTPVKLLVLPTIAANATDADRDGYPAGFDCRDDDAKIFPGAHEICGDGIDQDCDGRDLPTSSCDNDGDRISKDQGDCNDADSSVFPGARERCDAKDNDCNGTIDDGFGVGKTCTAGFGACAATGTTVCSASYATVVCSGTPGAPKPETCDGVDNDCNGVVDDVAAGASTDPKSCGGCGVVCPAVANAVPACVAGGCITRCAAGFVDADRSPANGCECQITNNGVEICDGKDNDCNGSVDEGITQPYYSGPAGTANLGTCMPGVQACVGGKLVVVRPDRIPSPELCDRLDNDCNGKVDESFDVTRDVRNCGACGNVCQVGAYCEAGVCKMQPGNTDGGVPVDRDASVPPMGDGGSNTGGPGVTLTICDGPNGQYCTDLRYDHGNCGACGKACAATESCNNGVCQSFDSCPAGARFCPDPRGTGKGTCTDLAFDNANCGGCGVLCGAMMVCDHGACVMGGGTTTCPATAPNVCKTPDGKLYCSDFGNDAANCGGCGLTCPAGTACSFGKCAGGGAADGGVAACPVDLPNACRRTDGTVYCTDVKKDVNNCGACGAPCPAGASCVGGVCSGGSTPSCVGGTQPCKDPAGNPICTDPMNDANNCGGCGKVCPAGVACVAGACSGTPTATCPWNASMQCQGQQGAYCTDPKTDPHNCGGCGILCAPGGVCFDGRCNPSGTCPVDRADVCKLMDGTAYCTSLRFDSANCGGCGRACPAGASCTDGVCGAPPPSSTCPPNMPVQCKDPNGNSYCSDGKSDPHNCGGCGIVCAPGGVCYDGRCDGSGMCPIDRSDVCRNPDGTAWCTNFRTDPQNCGACGKSCGPNASCNDGVCGASVPPGGCSPNQPMQCKDATGAPFCTSPSNDPHNCGACGNVCRPGTMCVAGRCDATTTCPAGAPNACANPDDTSFCADFRSDNANCGGCGRVCPSGTSCVGYQCAPNATMTCPPEAPAACMDPMGKPLCTDVMKDPQNCGRCGVVCVAGATCTNGACSGGVCPVDRPNVCPIAAGGTTCTDLRSDPQNCGMCGAVCGPNVACIGGVCGGTGATTCPATAPAQCQTAAGMPYCTNFQTDPGNCGGCGRACAAGVGCQMGVCGGGGTAMCPADLPNACSDQVGSWRCTDVRRDSQNCGKCGLACGSGQACTNGVCAAGTPMCEPPFTACTSGCTIFSDDPAHCGACDGKCDGVCQDGKCAPPGGSPSFGGCKQNADCPSGHVCFSEQGMGWPGGACVPICDAQRPCAAGQVCVPAAPSTGAFGTCRAKCAADADCGRDGTICADGLCQADCRRSPRVCGAGQVCTSTGACKPQEASCTAPTTFCRDASGAGYCSDARFDNRNCGMCGNACAAGTVCRDSKCVSESSAGLPGTGVCTGAMGAPMCVDLMHDPMNCGACRTVCTTDQFCDAGRCSAPPACPAGTSSCRDPVKNYPYCADPSRDSANCGGCGRVCAANSYCSNGMCIVGMSTTGTGGTATSTLKCPNGTQPCDSAVAGPSCVDVLADPKNCGGCGVVCPSGRCSNAVCQ